MLVFIINFLFFKNCNIDVSILFSLAFSLYKFIWSNAFHCLSFVELYVQYWDQLNMLCQDLLCQPSTIIVEGYLALNLSVVNVIVEISCLHKPIFHLCE